MIEGRNYFPLHGYKGELSAVDDNYRYSITISGRIWDSKLEEFVEPSLYMPSGYYLVNLRHTLYALPGSREPTDRYDRFDTEEEVRFLVARNFVPNPHGYTDVEPIDGNRWNHAAANLRWVPKDTSPQPTWDEIKRYPPLPS